MSDAKMFLGALGIVMMPWLLTLFGGCVPDAGAHNTSVFGDSTGGGGGGAGFDSTTDQGVNVGVNFCTDADATADDCYSSTPDGTMLISPEGTAELTITNTETTFGGDIEVPSTGTVEWATRAKLQSTEDGSIKILTNDGSASQCLKINSAGLLVLYQGDCTSDGIWGLERGGKIVFNADDGFDSHIRCTSSANCIYTVDGQQVMTLTSTQSSFLKTFSMKDSTSFIQGAGLLSDTFYICDNGVGCQRGVGSDHDRVMIYGDSSNLQKDRNHPTYTDTRFCVESSSDKTTTANKDNAICFYNDDTDSGIVSYDDEIPLYMDGGIRYRMTEVADVNYTTLGDDYFIAYTSLTATRTVTLDDDHCVAGRTLVIMDESDSASSTVKITIDPESTSTIHGLTTWDIDNEGESVSVVCVNSGGAGAANWRIF